MVVPSAADHRADGPIAAIVPRDQPIFAEIADGRSRADHAPGQAPKAEPAIYSVDFRGADIRDITRHVLGDVLKENYVIDPNVRGTSTLSLASPVTRSELLRMLDTMLIQNGATLVMKGDLYDVVPVAQVATAEADAVVAGAEILPLNFARADDIATLFHNYVSDGVLIAAAPARNAVLLGGDADTRAALKVLIQRLDTDLLKDLSYALLPATSGDPAELAAALSAALRAKPEGDLGDFVRVMPMDRIQAVLVIARSPGPLVEAERVFRLIEQAGRSTARSWHIHYIDHGDSDATAKLLIMAYPAAEADTSPGGSVPDSAAPASTAAPTAPDNQDTDGKPADAKPAEPSSGNLAAAAGSGLAQLKHDRIRIVPYKALNAILTYTSPVEESTIVGILVKIDLVPMQVRIDAVLAEVTTTDDLNYGTQFATKGGVEAALTKGTSQSIVPTGQGFSIYHIESNGAGAALSMAATVGTVRVLSSPQLTLMDNTTGSLAVGALVPYLSGSGEAVTTLAPTVVDTVNYAQTGVSLQIRPRIGSDGLVTLALDQELSDTDNTTTSTIGSPTFSTRSVESTVSVPDGQTIAIAGITRDAASRSNAGVPWIKDVPLLGAAVSTQTNMRTTTELLVLLTPHVIRDQHSARALTDDLRAGLDTAARTPQELKALPAGSANPNAALTR